MLLPSEWPNAKCAKVFLRTFLILMTRSVLEKHPHALRVGIPTVRASQNSVLTATPPVLRMLPRTVRTRAQSRVVFLRLRRQRASLPRSFDHTRSRHFGPFLQFRKRPTSRILKTNYYVVHFSKETANTVSTKTKISKSDDKKIFEICDKLQTPWSATVADLVCRKSVNHRRRACESENNRRPRPSFGIRVTQSAINLILVCNFSQTCLVCGDVSYCESATGLRQG